MAAPTGNKFWMNRTKHGREALFSDHALLWEAACEYFTWQDENDLIAIEFNGKDAERCEVPKMRAFTLKGLCLYLGVNSGYFLDYKARLSPRKKKDVPMLDVITRIEETIWVQKFEGAAAGFLHANLISREAGISEKVDTNVNGEVKNTHTGKVTVIHRQSGVPLGDTHTDGED